MKLLLRIATLVLLATTGACAATTAPSPTPPFSSFSVGFETGSVPPPFNYTYTLDGAFQPDALSVHYVLKYRFRDQATPDEITSQGYTTHDDIDWNGRLTGPAMDTWRTLLSTTTLGPIPPLAPGSDSFTVTLTPHSGDEQVGVPVNRDAWQTAITAVDKQARTETGATRTSP
jgi:hypothetical protein